MSHLAVDLSDTAILEAIERIGSVNVEPAPEGMAVLLYGQGVFAVRFLEAPRTPMDGDHAELLLRPLLGVGIAQFDGNLPRAFYGDGTAGFFPVDVHGEIGGKAGEILLPPRRGLKRSTEQFA